MATNTKTAIFTVIAVNNGKKQYMDPKKIGKMIFFHRKKSGLSQIEIARLSGIGKTALFDIEKGKLTVRLATLLKVMDVLNIKLKFESPLMELFERIELEES